MTSTLLLTTPSETYVREYLSFLPTSCWGTRDIYWDHITEWWELPTYAEKTGWGLVRFDGGELWYCYDARPTAGTITTCPAWEALTEDIPIGWLVWLSRHDTFTITFEDEEGKTGTTHHVKDIKTKLMQNNLDSFTLIRFVMDRLTELERAVAWLTEKVHELNFAPGMPGFVEAEGRFYAQAASREVQ